MGRESRLVLRDVMKRKPWLGDKRERASDALAAEDARDGWQLVKWQEECEKETNREERLEKHRAV